MDKPEEKPGPSGPLRPPRPPPGGMKPGSLPKGPVPPRGGMQLPGMKPMAPRPTAPASAMPPAPPAAKPPMMPPMPPAAPPAGGAKPPAPPAMPPMPPSLAVPPAVTNKLAEADAAKNNMEQHIADLEKKLMEEHEKVLMASLRTKEEEAVSAKVETSIKEIQDKLRREKREQELDEARRKAEGRALDLERRMAEEREAWVSTLKTQLSQRDTVSQEMETHFSSRLKDLEYRWAQEKSGLENAVREREAELARVRHEVQIKSEQEKSFWEDRVKSISAERDKLDREYERAKDKFAQEKDHLLLERQSLRDQVSKSDSMLKFLEDQQRVEKAAHQREADASQNLLKQQLGIEKETHEKQMASLQAQIQAHTRELTEKSAHMATLEQQLAAARAQAIQLDFRIQEKDKGMEELRRKVADSSGVTDTQRRKYELEIEELSKELGRARMSTKEEVIRAQSEAESRIKTLQTRLDWYDSNIKREYDSARLQVQGEVEQLSARLKESEKIISDMKLAEESRSKETTEASAKIQEANQARQAAEQIVDQMKLDWKQAQWNVEAQVKELSDQLSSTQSKLAQAEDARISLEQELHQRDANVNYAQNQMELRESELKKLTDRLDTMKKHLDFSKEKEASMEAQVADYKRVLQGKGLEGLEDVRIQLQDKQMALDKARESLQRANSQLHEAEKRDELFKDKENALKQIISGKDELVNETKNRQTLAERKLQIMQQEFDEFREHAKKDKERLVTIKQSEIDEAKAQVQAQVAKVVAQKQTEIEQAKRIAAEEMAEKMRAELPPPGPNSQVLESQLRQEMESQFLDQLREKETELEEKLLKSKEEAKKEIERLKWESETIKEEAKAARAARTQIEREAQELLQQADAHFQRELSKHMADSDRPEKRPKGFFSTVGLTIGKILDTPIIDTKNKKDDLSTPS